MSIEEKANVYDNALNKAKQLLFKCKRVSDKASMIYRAEDIESMFPELKESEDEKIRKELIKWCEEFPDLIWRGHNKNKVLAWLEKQGEQKSVEDSLTLEEFENAFITKAKQYDIDLPNRSWDIYALCKELYSLKHKPKQGEQKPFDYENANIQQKDFAPKVEPKFKAGDWIIFNGLTLYINEVTKGYYRTISKGGIPNSYDWNIDNAARLWNIGDAKESDVLSYVTDEEDLWIMIYWSLYEPYEGHVHYHALLVNDDFTDKGTCCIDIDNLKPATTEQRELLFTRMKESNYAWDENIKRVIKYGE